MTNKLVDAFAESGEPYAENAGEEETTGFEEEINRSEPEDTVPLSVKEGLVIIIAGGRKSAFAEWATSLNMLPDAAADMINEALYDRIGDAVLENNGEGYTVIEDYLPDIEQWIHNERE